MHLFLVRHGESVDNVAGLYAGTRDSSLTSHGVLQAQRLGGHLARNSDLGPVVHIFSSDLQRACKTAEAILDAQRSACSAADFQLELVKVPEIRERDFRSSEGIRFRANSPVQLTDAETHEEMRVRVDRFIEVHLKPILATDNPDLDSDKSIVVVAHGLILSIVLRAILSVFSPTELTRLYGEAESTRREHLAQWSNTGYLQALVRRDMASGKICLAVTGINRLNHLEGLKRTRGGIGSAKFDEKQKTVDSFFKPAVKRPQEGEGSGG